MPLTFPAHQAVVLPLKLWRPRWFDGTALVVGAGSPDLFNAFAFVDTFDSHHWDGIGLAVPFTVVYAIILRRFAADGLFGSLPDFGPLKARSYRVLAHGRPRLLVTTLSAFIGVASHIAVDSFTHAGRMGSNFLGLERTLVHSPLGPISGAKFLQYLGHTVGSVIGVLLFVLVVSRRHLGEWYGNDVIISARTAPLRHGARRRATLVALLSVAMGIVWGVSHGQFPIFHVGFTMVLGFLVIGIVNRSGPTILATCPDTFIPHAMTSSTQSAERSSKTSRHSAT